MKQSYTVFLSLIFLHNVSSIAAGVAGCLPTFLFILTVENGGCPHKDKLPWFFLLIIKKKKTKTKWKHSLFFIQIGAGVFVLFSCSINLQSVCHQQ